MTRFEDLPYRPCVGTIGAQTARAACSSASRSSGPEHLDMVHAWQMPQGGVDPGEDPWPAALRELYEETSIRSVERLGEIAEWLRLRHSARKSSARRGGGKYRGQTQINGTRCASSGDDREIDVATPGGGAHEPRIRRMALGADAEPVRAGGPVQAGRPTSGSSRSRQARGLRT